METKNLLGNIAKIVLPFVLGGAILWWMYRDEDLSVISHVLTEEMDWTWMLLSFPFGILAQMFRGWRWKQTLEPIFSRKEEGERRNEFSRKEEGGKRKKKCSAADSAKDYPHQGHLLPPSSFLLPRIRSSVCIYAVFLSYAASLVIPRIGEFSRCAILKR